MSMPVNNIRASAIAGLPLLILAVAVSIAVWFNTSTKPFPTGSRLSIHQALMSIPEEDTADQLKNLVPQALFTGRDPFFRPPAAQPLEPVKADTIAGTAVLQEIHLTTIAQGNRGNYCLINGRIYNEGQQGEGFTVGEITDREVFFTTPVQTFSLIPGNKVTLESGKLLNREDKNTETGVNNQDAEIQ